MSFELGSAEEMKSQGYENAALIADNYILKIAKITLEKQPTWNAAANAMDYSKTELQYSVFMIPYKSITDDEMKDTLGRTVEPLETKIIIKKVNPFSLGKQPSGEPSNLRALLAYGSGKNSVVDANARLTIEKLVVIDANDNVIDDPTIVNAYLSELKKLTEGEIQPQEFTMKLKGYRHIPDARPLQGNYIVGKLVANTEKANNTLSNFSRVPSSFTPDTALEAEAVVKFEEVYAKMQAKREARKSESSAPAAKAAAVSYEAVDQDDLPF